jgi:hypothetical protein
MRGQGGKHVLSHPILGTVAPVGGDTVVALSCISWLDLAVTSGFPPGVSLSPPGPNREKLDQRFAYFVEVGGYNL